MDSPWSWVFLGVIVAAIIALLVWSFISNKKRRKNIEETINAIKPGNKVKTVGGVIGEVVEVNEEEGTFVMRTGDSFGNCSYMKFDKQAIYQTDAKPEPAAPAAEKAASTEVTKAAAEEKPAAEPFAAETAEAPAAEKEEAQAAEEKAEKPAASKKKSK